mgnify:CR=1 FL=1
MYPFSPSHPTVFALNPISLWTCFWQVKANESNIWNFSQIKKKMYILTRVFGGQGLDPQQYWQNMENIFCGERGLLRFSKHTMWVDNYPWSWLLKHHVWEIFGRAGPILQTWLEMAPKKDSGIPQSHGALLKPSCKYFCSIPLRPFKLFTHPAFYAALNKISFTGHATLLKAHSITDKAGVSILRAV